MDKHRQNGPCLGACRRETRLGYESGVVPTNLPCDLSGPQSAHLYKEEIGFLSLVEHQDPLGNSSLKIQKPVPHSTPPESQDLWSIFVLLVSFA